jgi:hypothetical protein
VVCFGGNFSLNGDRHNINCKLIFEKMELEKQVCTYEQARRLKELGIDQTSCYFCWINEIKVNDEVDLSSATLMSDDEAYGNVRGYLYTDYRYAAFTVAELGVMLDASQKSYLAALGSVRLERDQRAEKLIELLESGKLKAEDANKRLYAN